MVGYGWDEVVCDDNIWPGLDHIATKLTPFSPCDQNVDQSLPGFAHLVVFRESLSKITAETIRV